jgi:dolichol kinase
MDMLEFRRQVFHALFGIILASAIYFEFVDFFVLFGVTIISILLSIISKKHKIPLITFLLQQFDREKDIKRMPGKGALYFMIGVIITYGMFITQPDGKNIICASIMILALGDAMPHFIAHIGKIKHPFSDRKYIEASMFGALVAFLGALFFVRPLEAFIASVVAMFVEGIDLKTGIEWDDNITVPVVAGVTIWLLRLIL